MRRVGADDEYLDAGAEDVGLLFLHRCAAAGGEEQGAGEDQEMAHSCSSAVMKAAEASKPGLLADFDHAGRAGDVDFGEVVADDVDADQQQAAREEDGASASAISRSRASAPARRRCRRPPDCPAFPRPSGCAPDNTVPVCRQ
jgi:hypothetical protein